MINKEKLRSMINHHFGNVDNKENFINELFDNCNLLISGRLQDDEGKLTDDIDKSFDLKFNIEAMNESAEITVYNSKEGYSGVAFHYYNQKNSDNDLFCYCESKGTENFFQIDSGSHDVFRHDLTVKHFIELLKLESSIKYISKMFK